ncbi:HPr kinase/phosphatase C-terminal domain-containing protein [Labrenzia sp. 011]|uniref:HPr kinase/phosphorylase n=1 Tax=Labrenzia sp. 011 TaxID=2171494 RepID=UPI000D50CA9F|nr:HPr kinase/phosphatase C-terminal domain-containing protein [Labrenzia sp. 011]PVB61377.1 aldolase [Labrenzia sp. 011]
MTGQSIHANCVIVGTCGVLIRGEAGSGKSLLSETLIEAARARGHFAALVADDRVLLEADDGRLLARAPETIQGRIEVRGFALEDITYEPVARIRLVIDLKPLETLERLPDMAIDQDWLAGIFLPAIACPSHRPAIALRQLRWAMRRLLSGGPDYI